MKSRFILSIFFFSFLMTGISCLGSLPVCFGNVAQKISCHILTDKDDDKVNQIEWLDFETAIDRNEKKKKYIFIDIYTDWCGWCKKMDAGTFKDADVVEYMSENFYAVKMNAESREGIVFKDILYEYKMYSGGKGYNELAVNLLGGKMSFPSFVILSKREVKIGTIIGYQKPNALISSLKKYTKDK